MWSYTTKKVMARGGKTKVKTESRPMTKEEEARFDAAFDRMDEAFAKMDEAFEELRKI